MSNDNHKTTLQKTDEFLLNILDDLNSPDLTIDELEQITKKAEASAKVAKVITENAKVIVANEKVRNDRAKIVLQAEKMRYNDGLVYDETIAPLIGVEANKRLKG